MKFEYDYTFGLPRKIVWKYLKDEGILKKSIPNCRSFVETSKGLYHGRIDIKLGPIQDQFDISIKRQVEKSPSLYRLFVKGKGSLGEVNAHANILLKEAQQGTSLNCKIEGQLSGALSLAEHHLTRGISNKSLETFFQAVEKEIKKSLYYMKRR
ncbi:SRPBCC domain-containing protein [Neobacillus muris]|uniref:SRPBCC domain-containing protein n=1 Tax=Neobacillus muris TaxID=2941334 RepID=UPI00203B5906|nr:SRPBCC domain-containing protein [Neobacillus muris]